MMIRKENRLVITFHTTTDAMAMENVCKTENVAGRLIPVPRIITAGCGLAWSAPPSEEENLCKLMAEKGIRFQAIQQCLV